MKKLVLTGLVSALLLSTSAFASTSIGAGYQIMDFTPAEGGPSFDHGVFIGSLSYQPSEHIVGSILAGFATDEKELSRQSDTFRDASPIGAPIQERLYRSTAEMRNLLGAEISWILPTTKHISLQVDAGYITSEWESSVYSTFVDNAPAADHEQALRDGLTDCQITGNEADICGTPIELTENDGRISAPYLGATLKWTISKHTKITFSGKKSVTDTKGEFTSWGAGVQFSW